MHMPTYPSLQANTQPIAAANQYKARNCACITLCRCVYVGVGLFESTESMFGILSDYGAL